MSHANFPAGYGLCPKCNGTCRIPVTPEQEPYKTIMSGYDKTTDTMKCDNCGGQCMFGEPKGYTTLREDGSPCLHSYNGEKRGNCYYVYRCKHCTFSFDIDSGD